MLIKKFAQPSGHLLLILVLGTLAYSNSFHVPFVLDDLDSITSNSVIKDIRNFLPDGPGYEFQPRRWVAYLSFALNYHFGGLDVTGYHLVNLAVHLINSLLIYAFIVLTFRTPNLAASRLAPQAGTAALLAALFFVVHPVQTQAVTYIVQRLASLCTLFYLLSLVLYVQARLRFESRVSSHVESGNKHIGSSTPQTFPLVLLSGSVISAVLAMFTKEIAFTLPFAAVLCEVFFFRGEWKRRAFMLLPLLLALPIIPVAVLTSGGEATDAQLINGSELRQQTEIPRLHYLFTQFRVIVTYLRLLVLPSNQNLDYDYPVFTSFFAPPILLSFLLLTTLFLFAIYLYAIGVKGSIQSRVTSHESRLVAFGIFWFFLTLSVESSLIPITDVIFEHRLYLPAVGPAIALAVTVIWASQKSLSQLSGRLPLLAAGLVVAVLATATYKRNQVWQSEVSLWEDTSSKSPAKARPWYNLGTHLTAAGRPAEAITALSRAVRIDPDYAEAWHNLGRSFLLSGRDSEALAPLRAAVRVNPEMGNAVVNYSVALINTGNSQEAVEHLERVRRHFPNWPEVRLNLGIAYVRSGNLPAARGELAILIRLAPHLTPPLAEQIRAATAAQ